MPIMNRFYSNRKKSVKFIYYDRKQKNLGAICMYFFPYMRVIDVGFSLLYSVLKYRKRQNLRAVLR